MPISIVSNHAPWRLSRLLLVAGTLLTLISLAGMVLFVRSRDIMQSQLEDKLKDTAQLGSLKFEHEDLKNIWTREDMQTPVFQNTVRKLRRIRESIPTIRYVYIMRRSANDHQLLFVADADSLATVGDLDRNKNGSIDRSEQASYPGDIYDISGTTSLRDEAFLQPSVDKQIHSDQWGSSISGYAPIYSDTGAVIAVLGVDMNPDEFFQLSHSMFSPVALLLLLLGAVCLAAYLIHFVWARRLESLRDIEEHRSAIMDLTLHQLGMPLALFKWWLEIFKDSKGDIKNGDDIYAQMVEGVARMDSIMVALREANEVRKGTINYRPQMASLADLIHQEVKVGLSTANAHHQKIEEVIDPSLGMLNFDRKLVSAVIRELLDNAMSYSPKETTITIRSTRTKDKVQVEVQDEGCGIPAADKPHIFEKFMRARNATKMKAAGNGLGLYTARGIIQSAGGEMWMESTEGKGSTFFFTLPIA